MNSLQNTLIESLKNAFLQAFPALDTSFLPEVVRTEDERFGDYQCNSAMKLAKPLSLPPRKIAEAAATCFDRSLFDKVEIAGPGFINLHLKTSALEKRLKDLENSPSLCIQEKAGAKKKKKKVIVDFSSPNIAKEMHVGHLRSTIIGDALARIFTFLGDDVLRLNHVGDFGTSFGMLIAYIKAENLTPSTLKGATLTDLNAWYRAAKKRFDEDADFKKESQLEVVKLQSGEPQARETWEWICQVSRKAFEEIYDLLDIHLVERGESFYQPWLKEVVDELKEKRLATRSEGALCVFLEGFASRDGTPLPLMIEKSDGGYTYATTDLAALKHRLEDEKADEIFYVTDAGQGTHFSQVYKTGEKAGWWDPSRVRIDHVPFGLVLGSDGKKFRTRSGDTEKLADLLQAAIDKAGEILKERQLQDEAIVESAKILGINAVKYADLACMRTGDYVFSYDRMLRFEGNTAAFLLYAYVRCKSIMKKTKGEIGSPSLEHPSERALGLQILRFYETLESVKKDLFPHRLAEYLYELAEKFHAFFRDCRVEGDPREASRLALVDLTAKTLKTGLELLGLRTLERM